VSHEPCLKGKRPQDQDPAVDFFYSAAKRRSRGVLWSIFALALIIFVERIREAAESHESHPGKLTEEIVRFIEAVESSKKPDGDQGAQEIPNLP
jgi:hypothetical protein